MEDQIFPSLVSLSKKLQNEEMKTTLFIILAFFISCNKSSGGAKVAEAAQTPVETPGTPTSPTPTPTNPALNWTEEFMELVNTHRITLGLRPLIHSESLATIVTEHSQNMANKSVAFGHDGFSGRCSESRNALGGGNWCGENVAMGQKTPQNAFNSWMNSSGHRANIEQSRATHTGFGFAKNSAGTYYWTQIFIEL